jgi:hypothetical protein
MNAYPPFLSSFSNFPSINQLKISMRTSLLPTSSRKIIFACNHKPISSLFPAISKSFPSKTAQIQQQSNMSTSSTPSASDLGIESDIKTATGISLSSQQKVIVGSVLDVSEIKNQTKQQGNTQRFRKS